MFGDDRIQQLQTLKKLSFLDASQEPKIAVITFITSHVNNTINPEDKEEYMKRICEYYIDILADYFKINNTQL